MRSTMGLLRLQVARRPLRSTGRMKPLLQKLGACQHYELDSRRTKNEHAAGSRLDEPRSQAVIVHVTMQDILHWTQRSLQHLRRGYFHEYMITCSPYEMGQEIRDRSVVLYSGFDYPGDWHT